jgi:putative aminopeptidase FrvX
MNPRKPIDSKWINQEKLDLLKVLCAIPGTSGDEGPVRDFVLDYVKKNQALWKSAPEIWAGNGFQENMALIFGKPQKAFYAHLDTVGYTIRYNNNVIPVGGPDGQTGDLLVFEENGKPGETRLIHEADEHLFLVSYPQNIQPGTTLTYFPIFECDGEWIKSPYLDNRLGVWALLLMAEWAENAAFVFTTFEEHGGGGAGIMAKILFEKFGTTQSIITDVTWTSEGVFAGNGPVVSLRDSRIPRKEFVKEIRQHLEKHNIPYQLEVEQHGGSDGREIQHLPYPIDWCFIGPPSENPHSSLESVHFRDAEGFLQMLKSLLPEQ